MSNDAVPVVDISNLYTSNVAKRNQVAADINRACESLGFMYVTGHGVDADLRQAVFDQAARLFAKPEGYKLDLHMSNSPCNRGYEPLRSQTLEAGTPPDLKEGFYLGADLPPDHPRVVDGWFNHGPNQWPPEMPGFRSVMEDYHASMIALGGTLMEGLALSLDLPDDYFDDYCAEAVGILRLLHYPPQPANADPDEKGCGAHTDWGGITLLMQDDAGGLQVHGPDGNWIHAPPREDAFVVNLGDMIARWTNDRYRSTLHRVVNISGRERYSVPFFFEGNPEHKVVVLENCIAAGEKANYPPTTVDGHLREMYDRTYGEA